MADCIFSYRLKLYSSSSVSPIVKIVYYMYMNMLVHSHGHMVILSLLSPLLLNAKSFVCVYMMCMASHVIKQHQRAWRERINFANYSSIALTVFCHLNNNTKFSPFPNAFRFFLLVLLRNLMDGKLSRFTLTIKSALRVTEKIISCFFYIRRQQLKIL